ncbi:MAG: hypothetical protein ACPHID_04480 [Thermoplasmatota archaeon]
MYCVTVPLVDRPGAAAGVMDILAAHQIPIHAYMLGRGRLHIATVEGETCKSALEEGGLDAYCAPMIRLDLPDEPGLLGQLFNALADAFINVLVSFGVGRGDDGTIYLQVNDPRRAQPILDQFGVSAIADA